MAQIVLGPLVANIAGSIGGSTFQRGPGIHTVRRKPIPILRRSTFTNGLRSVFLSLNMSWRSLTDIQRDAWQSEADLVTWTDRFGNVIPGKGYWLYKRCNLNRNVIGFAPITDPDTVPTFDAVTGIDLTLVIGAKFELKWDAPIPTQGSTYWAISATPPCSAGRSAAFGTFRFISNLAPGSTTPADFLSDYLARYPTAAVAGQRTFLRIVVIDKSSGYAMPPQIISAIWA